MNDDVREWIFTFGVQHPQGRNFVRITGTHEGARQEMVRRYGLKWAFQYESEEKAGVTKWGLTEIDR